MLSGGCVKIMCGEAHKLCGVLLFFQIFYLKEKSKSPLPALSGSVVSFVSYFKFKKKRKKIEDNKVYRLN